MKRIIISAAVVAASALLSSCATRNHAQAANTQTQYDAVAPGTMAPEGDWPMTFVDGGTLYTIYPPQCDSWDGHELSARSAVAVQPAGTAEPTYGVVTFNAITLVNKTARTVTLANFHATSGDFPSARAQTQNYLAPIAQNLSQHAPALPLEQLEGSMAVSTPPKAERLDNDPPKIIVATRPSMLVAVDGPPAWRSVAGTGLQRVINTRMLLLKDSSGQCYLHLFNGYLEAPSLQGPWAVAKAPPAGAAKAEQEATSTGQVDLMQGTPDAVTGKIPSLGVSPAPDVIVATRPTELIQLHGSPEFVSIPGTDLLYAGNTSGNIFKSLTDQENYILISGRWYRSASLDGSWQFVPGNQLPHDFANIPDNSPKENVKASVPGTSQAEEALVANSVPESTGVPRASQMPPPQFDGAMQLASIAGTPLHYVVNSPTPVLEVTPQSWYACQDGVWYDSVSPNGPWSAAASVPQVIYSIPMDSPLHYLTYVQVYGTSPDLVYEGYTPGYMGTEVADDGTVVYGTGYDYNPWVGTVWYGPPVTWGWGFDCCWNPWWGWGFGCGFGWGWGWGGPFFYPPYPGWGGFRHGFNHFDRGGWHGEHGYYANTGANVYNHNPKGMDGGASAYARHGEEGGLGQAYNSRTGWLQGGQHARVLSVPTASWNGSREAGLAGRGNGAWAQHGGYAWRSSGYAPRFYGAPRGGQSWSGGHVESRGGSEGGGFRGGGGGGGFRGGGGGGGRR